MHRPLQDLTPGAVLIPVPLHRSRLWSRGFNQAALIAGALARLSDHRADAFVMRRVKRTPKLKGMSVEERRRAVSGAFALRAGRSVKGGHFILVDDVYTSGSTAAADSPSTRPAATTVSLSVPARSSALTAT